MVFTPSATIGEKESDWAENIGENAGFLMMLPPLTRPMKIPELAYLPYVARATVYTF